MSRKALGRGLKALIPESKVTTGREFMELDVERIFPGRSQPRKEFDERAIGELADSIKTHGILQPLIVQTMEGGRFELIAGERRWRAAQQAGLNKVPALIKNADEAESLEMALIENLQREDLNPMEAARAYSQFAEKFDLTQEEIASRVGKDRSSVANHLRLLKLPSEIQDDLIRGRLTMGHARAILSLHSREKQLLARKRILNLGLSVRNTEKLAKKMSGQGEDREPNNKKNDLFIKGLEDWLRRALGTKVSIRQGKKGGTIEVQYFSTAELERLTEKITGEVFQ